MKNKTNIVDVPLPGSGCILITYGGNKYGRKGIIGRR